MNKKSEAVQVTGQECLTSPVGREGINTLPRGRVLKFLPLAPSARGEEIRTLPWAQWADTNKK